MTQPKSRRRPPSAASACLVHSGLARRRRRRTDHPSADADTVAAGQRTDHGGGLPRDRLRSGAAFRPHRAAPGRRAPGDVQRLRRAGVPAGRLADAAVEPGAQPERSTAAGGGAGAGAGRAVATVAGVRPAVRLGRRLSGSRAMAPGYSPPPCAASRSAGICRARSVSSAISCRPPCPCWCWPSGAIALTGLYGMLPSELRIAALVLYGLVLLPLGCLVIANRTLRALAVRTPRPRRRSDLGPPPASAAAHAPRPVLSEQERTAGSPEQAAALLAATRDGDIERALALLEAGADPNTAPADDERDQRPVLMLAALLPDTRLLRALIARGADVNRASGGITPLLAATRDSWHGRAEAVLTLLANGANPLATDARRQYRPARRRAQRRTGRGGDAARRRRHRSTRSTRPALSPLAIACRAANWPLAKFLLERGAKPAPAEASRRWWPPPASPTTTSTGRQAAAQAPRRDQRRRCTQAHALLSAAAEGHEQIARALCAAGADVNLADRHGSTALMEAARAGASGIVQLLAEARARCAGARPARPRRADPRLPVAACRMPKPSRALLALGAEPKTPRQRRPQRARPCRRCRSLGSGRPARSGYAAADQPQPGSAGRRRRHPAAPARRAALRPLGGRVRFCRTRARMAAARNWPSCIWIWPHRALPPPGAGCSTTACDAEARLERRSSMTPDDDAPVLPPPGRRLFDALLRNCRIRPKRSRICCRPAPRPPAPACWRWR